MVVGHYGVNVDADQDADVRDVAEERANGEVARGAQETDQGVKPLDIGVALEDTLEFSEEGLIAVVGKEAGGHRLKAHQAVFTRGWVARA